MRLDRLRECIVALLESPAPERFAMEKYYHPCGTPACILGHHAHRYGHGLWPFNATRNTVSCLTTWHVSAAYFDLSEGQWDELFGEGACGGAATPRQAITYLEGFISKHARSAVAGA